MLQIKNIRKEYITGDLHQTALDDVSLSLRDSEFVAILGPSGSGKTTLLNIIGGLDRYDSGDLIINDVSTKNYKDRDWDSYRNHTIGFVFQSYNLIPHQTVLANVELALTISGVSADERRKRAAEALVRVGLGDHMHKRPNQLSGGQMQRVAIARALVNDPDILLADEPTGALDTVTSVQIMELLKEVAGDRLVVMVTHNPELAEEYATRIVKLRDGHIVGDTDPFVPEEVSAAEHRNLGKSSMAFTTALGLSFNNLRTKKLRTFLTAFAGSIGIIGIALIMSLSNGVNDYIGNIQEDALSEYPLTIFKSSMDFSTLLDENRKNDEDRLNGTDKAKEAGVDVLESQTLEKSLSQSKTNDLGALRDYLESDESHVYDYANAIEYKYGITPNIFRMEGKTKFRRVNPDDLFSRARGGLFAASMSGDMSGMTMLGSGSIFQSLPESDTLYKKQYDLKDGRWPKDKFECVLVLAQDGTLPDLTLYSLGLKDPDKLEALLDRYEKGKDVEITEKPGSYSYSDFTGMKFKVVNSTEYYQYDASVGVYVNKADDKAFMLDKVRAGDDLTIVGVVQPKPDTKVAMLGTGIAYRPELELHLMKQAAESEIVKKQLADKDINVFTGKKFGEAAGLDMDSVFSIDRDAFKNAFKFNEAAFNNIDFSDIRIDTSKLKFDFSDVKFDSSILDEIDTEQLVKDVNVAVSDEELNKMANKLMAGFLGYIASNPNISIKDLSDASKLTAAVMGYMQTEAAQKIMAEDIGKVVDTKKLKKAISKSLSGVSEELVEKAFSSALAGMGDELGKQLSSQLSSQIGSKMAGAMKDAFSVDPDAIANAFQVNVDENTISDAMASMMEASQASYDDNLSTLNYANVDQPNAIYIYPKDFKNKEDVVSILDGYNDDMESEGKDSKVITYTDTVATLMSSVTEIVDTVSYVLIAFVAISLIVSSIMIGIITYISVLERTKEIGILRAIGASKRNVSQVFNAETFITGLLAGIIGIVTSLLLLIPINAIIHAKLNSDSVVAMLPPQSAVILIILSILLTLIGGFIPSKSAAKKDPVAALRTE